MSLHETLGANVTRLVHERTERDGIGLSDIWATLAAEGWPDDAATMASGRAVWIEAIAKGDRWPSSAQNLAALAAVLEVHAWELLRPRGAGRLGTPAGIALGSL